MAKVRFTSVLKNFFPEIKEESIDATDVSELLLKINNKYPGISDYLLDESGKLRGHVALYVGEEVIPRDKKPDQILKPNDQVLIYQAISGG